MELDVVFESVLEIGKNPLSNSSKEWKPRLCVLKRHGNTKRSTLDYYKDTRKRWQKQVAKGVISLWPWFTVTLAHNSSYKYPMKLMTAEHTIYLSASSYQLMNQWFYHIQTQKIIEAPKIGSYTFTVQAQDSDSMNIIGANGDCLLALTTELDIQCALLPSKKVVCIWPFESLRKYWCGDGLFGFECGRRAPHGEGRFIFITNQEEKIYKMLEKFIDKTKRRSAFCTPSSSEASLVDDRPPAPLPSEARHSETPPVKSSDSDDEFENNPPVPPKPHNMQVPISPDWSTTSPAYIRKTHSNAAGGHQWLHKSIESPEVGNRGVGMGELPNPHVHPPRPVVFNTETVHSRDPLEEDTYSHTVHTVPAPFQLQKDHSVVVGESTYNALVHTKGPKASSKEKKNPSEDTLYDVAYPDAKARQIMHPDSEDDEYSKPTFDSTDGNIPRTTMPLSKMPLGKHEIRRMIEPLKSDATTTDGISASLQSEDGMTRNPLYGSQDDLLAALETLEGEIDVEIERPVASPASPVVCSKKQSEKQATNPVYGDTTVATELDTQQDDAEEPDNDKTKENQDNGTDSKVQNTEVNELASEGSAASIERDSKGYSKVDKNKKMCKQDDCPDLETVGDTADLAPPVPERLYSYDDDDAI